MSLPDTLRDHLPEHVDPEDLDASLVLGGSPDASLGETAFVVYEGELFAFHRPSLSKPWQPLSLEEDEPLRLETGDFEGILHVAPHEREPFTLKVPAFEQETLEDLIDALAAEDDDEEVLLDENDTQVPEPEADTPSASTSEPLASTGTDPSQEEPAPTPSSVAPMDFDDEPITVKRNWIPMVVALLILGGIGFAIYYFVLKPHPIPNRMIVTVTVTYSDGTVANWWTQHDEAAEAISAELRERLAGYGFELVEVTGEDAELLAQATDLESLKDAARKLEIGILVSGTLRVENTVPIIEDKLHDHFITLHLTLHDLTTDDSTPIEVEVPTRFLEDGTSEKKALRDVSNRAALHAVGPLVQGLAEVPGLSKYRSKEGLDHKEVDFARKLELLFFAAKDFPEGLEQRRQEEDRLEIERIDAELAPQPRTRLTAPLDETYFIGEAPDGQLYFMRDPHVIYLDPSQSRGYGVETEYDSMVLTDAEGKNPRSIFEFIDFQGIPKMSNDGSTLAVIVHHRRSARSIAVIDTADQSTRHLAYHRNHYYNLIALSPDGKRIAFLSRDKRRSPSRLEVMDTTGENRRVLIPEGVGKFSAPTWSNDKRTLYVAIRSDEGGGESVWSVDVDNGNLTPILGPAARPPEPELPPGQEEPTPAPTPSDPSADPFGEEPQTPPPDPRYESEFEIPLFSPAGDALFVREWTIDGRRYIGRYDLESATYTRIYKMDNRRRRPERERYELSHDGEMLALQTYTVKHPEDRSQGDLEIVTLPSDGSGEPVSITINDIHDKIGGWSLDGAHLFIQQGNRDPNAWHWTNRVYRVDLGP